MVMLLQLRFMGGNSPSSMNWLSRQQSTIGLGLPLRPWYSAQRYLHSQKCTCSACCKQWYHHVHICSTWYQSRSSVEVSHV